MGTTVDLKACDTYIELSIKAATGNLCSKTIPIQLLSDLFDVITLDQCEKLFSTIERNIILWKSEEFFTPIRNNLLRICNGLCSLFGSERKERGTVAQSSGKWPKSGPIWIWSIILGYSLKQMSWYRAPTTDTQRRFKSKISEKLGRCGRQNMLWPYLKIWEWEWIFGCAVKAISSLGIHSPCYWSKLWWFVFFQAGLAVL